MILLREFEQLPYEELGAGPVAELERLCERTGLRVFDFRRSHLRARNLVGVLQTTAGAVQILPKVFEKDEENLTFLIRLLEFTSGVRARETGSSEFRDLGGSFLEIWIYHFAKELNFLLRHRPLHRYTEVEAQELFIKGKLLIQNMIDGGERFSTRYPVRYEVFGPNHLLNRVLRFCNRLLLGIANNEKTRVILRENDALLVDTELVPATVEDLRRIHLNRLNDHYQAVLTWCKLLLSRSTLDLRAGRIVQLAFVFDMNVLFEEFVHKLLRRHMKTLHFGDSLPLRSVQPQAYLGRVFGEFQMKVDFLLEDTAGQRLLLDTKYKIADEGERHWGLKQTDFYQMFSYGKAGKAEFEDIMLLYTGEDLQPRTFEGRGSSLHVRALDLTEIWDPCRAILVEEAAVELLARALRFRIPAKSVPAAVTPWRTGS